MQSLQLCLSISPGLVLMAPNLLSSTPHPTVLLALLISWPYLVLQTPSPTYLLALPRPPRSHLPNHAPTPTPRRALQPPPSGTSLRPVQAFSSSPANKCGDDDAPGGAATVCVKVLVCLPPPAAQPEGIEEQEEEV